LCITDASDKNSIQPLISVLAQPSDVLDYFSSQEGFITARQPSQAKARKTRESH
jgi:hypothetical protein